LDNFQRDGTIREKYNVVTRSSEIQVAAGYAANVVGFGWTNGVFVELLSRLPADWVERLRQGPAAKKAHEESTESLLHRLHPARNRF
jgi:hypothetical protein